METKAISAVRPQWIARMFPSTGGQDHLGLGSVSSDQILPTLSPGINVITVHPRYHSFYAFLLDEFWRRDLPRTRASWVSFFRPRDFVYALGAHLCDRPEHGELDGIVSGRKTGPLAAQRRPFYGYVAEYIKEPLGGYGLYYRAVMAELGFLYPGGNGLPYPVDVPTDDRGRQLAAAFRQDVEDTDYYREHFDGAHDAIPLDVVVGFGRRACLCQLQRHDAPDRPSILGAFLDAGVGSDARRETFRMLLDIADKTDGYPIDEDAFRQLLYFGAADNGARYEPAAYVDPTFRRWHLYQAREYYALALNALWSYLCRWGISRRGDARPLPLTEFWDHLAATADFGGLSRWLGVSSPEIGATSTVADLIAWLREGVASSGEDFDTPWALESPIQEHRLYRLATSGSADPGVLVAGMVALLGLLFVRFGRPDVWFRDEWAVSRAGGDLRLSVDRFVKDMRRWVADSMSVGEFLRVVYRDSIINQHLLIANSKWPNNTFRFERQGERLRFHDLPAPVGFQNSRFGALSTTVHELGLCGSFRRPSHPLTPDGRRLLLEGRLA